KMEEQKSNFNALKSKDKELVWHPYTQEKTAGENVFIAKGEGAYLFDENGKKYLDANASWWTNTHGHAHPYIAQKLFEQASTLEHVIFAGYTHEPAIRLAEKLQPFLPENQAKFFYSDNGSTAVEVALKMAFQFWFNQGEKRTTILAFENAYHGDTFGAMSVSARGLFTDPFKPLLFDVVTMPVPTRENIAALLVQIEELLQQHKFAGFIYEPLVQGSHGMNIYEADLLNQILAKLQSENVLLIADEVFTGFGRTGKFLASDYVATQANIFCFSKGLTAGVLPLGLTTCSQKIYDIFYSNDKTKTLFHGHSFSGNPIGCAVALASLDVFEMENTMERVARIESWHASFIPRLASHKNVVNIAQQGTILRFEVLNENETSYTNPLKENAISFFRERGIMLRPLGNVMYFLPPYCVNENDLEHLYKTTEAFLKQLQ
ncbi:MAG TPA: adenosylmethionine--8-amino-7-oxononanoate transaminase, partial [Chitinophagales bacterium]